MSRFIKLTNLVVNTSKIIKIKTLPDIHYMYLSNTRFDGFFLFSSGSIDTKDDIVEVCKNKNPIDYHLVSEWIKQI
jgi:hypothetical protein